MVGASAYEVLMLLINLGWIIYNLIILFAAMAVTVESVQKRKFPRVSFTAPVHLQVGETFDSGRYVRFLSERLRRRLEKTLQT